MPVTRTAEKELRVARRRGVRNRSTRTLCKTNVKNAEKPIIAGDMEFAAKEAVVAISTLDKAANKGAIHPNKAARTKSRLMKKLNKAQQITSQAKAEKK